MYRSTEKTRAMMASRLVADVSVAPILSDSLVRAATVSTRTFQGWVDQSEMTTEVSTATDVVMRNLRAIERNAQSIQSCPISQGALRDFQEAKMSLKTLWRHKEGSEITSSDEDNATGDKNGAPATGGSCDPVTPKKLLSDSRSTNDSVSFENALTDNRPQGHRGSGQMEKDVEQSVRKSLFHFIILFILIVLILVVGSVVIVFFHRSQHEKKVDNLEKRVTIDLALNVEKALNALYDALDAMNVNMKVEGRTIAASLLADVSSRQSSDQDVLKMSNNYLTDYRGVVQDFDNSNEITNVLTNRAYGGLCQNNMTFKIQLDNDISANKTYVVPQLTPFACGNDVTSTGIFSTVVPSYLRYSPYGVTYRRNLARVAAFDHPGFGISVAVTRDRETVQQYLTPKETLIGPRQKLGSAMSEWESEVAVWCGVALSIVSALLVVLLLWWMSSEWAFSDAVFPLLVGLLVSGALAIVFLITQTVLGKALHAATLLTTTSLVEGVAGLLLSPSVAEAKCASQYLKAVYSDTFKGLLFISDILGTLVVPEDMVPVADAINATHIASYRRGQYAGLVKGYAVSSSFIPAVDYNLVVARKLPTVYHANICILVIIGFGVIALILSSGYVRYSPLHRLRRFVVGMPIAYYYVHPSTIRFLFYGAILLFPLVGIICVNCFGVSEMQKETTKIAENSLVILGALLRTPGLADSCNYGCGMPDYTVSLYFSKNESVIAKAPTIRYVGEELSYPYPFVDNWAFNYLGAQLSVNNVHTTIVDSPAFFSPLVNSSSNETEPKDVVRNMLSTTGINNTYAFAIERFSSSYVPKAYGFISHSIGICIMLILSSIVITVCEWQYVRMHVRKQSNQSLWLSFIIMAGMVSLLLLGFVAHGVAMKFFIHSELVEFSRSELALIASAVSYRLHLFTLPKQEENFTKYVEELSAIVAAASISSMKMATVISRVRLAYEFPERGSNQFIIAGVPMKDPVNIGPLDKGQIPVCGTVPGRYISNYVTETMNYCYVEIEQNAVKDPEKTPRYFVIAATSLETWVESPSKSVWSRFLLFCILVGVLISVLLFLFLFNAMHASYEADFPLMKAREMVSFAAPLRSRKEAFLPRRHRLLWVGSVLFLGILLLYYTASVGVFMSTIDASLAITTEYSTQGDELTALITDVQSAGYDYIIFPIAKATVNRITGMLTNAESGQGAYRFITAEGLKAFEDGAYAIYANLTGTKGILSGMLSAAAEGYGSFDGVMADRYESEYIYRQNLVFEQLDKIEDALSSEVAGTTASGVLPSTAQRIATMTFMRTLMELREMSRKLFILDHMVINSYAVVSSSVPFNWPFTEKIDLISASAQKAATYLRTKVDAQLAQLRILVQQFSSSPEVIENYINQFAAHLELAYALNQGGSAEIWYIQASRLDEASYINNATRNSMALKEQAQELARINESSVLFEYVNDIELFTRKTYQLREYIVEGRPLEDGQTTIGWQRWKALRETRRMYLIAFACTLSTFVVVWGSILLHFYLMRQRTELIQENISKFVERVRGSLHFPTRRAKSMNVRKCNADIKVVSPAAPVGATSPAKTEPDMLRANSGFTSGVYIDENDDLWHSAKNTDCHEVAELQKDKLESDSEKALKINEEEQDAPVQAPVMGHAKRQERFVISSVGALLLITSIPLCCSFWLLVRAHHVVESQLDEISSILLLYSRVIDAVDDLASVLNKLSMAYVGIASTKDTLLFLDDLILQLKHLAGVYRWIMQSPLKSLMKSIGAAVTQLSASVQAEIKAFSDIKAYNQLPNYPATESGYTRKILPSLGDENEYGTLLPIGATTSGSATNDFASSAFTTAMTQAAIAQTCSAYTDAFNTYQSVVDVFDQISKAELLVWNTVVAAPKSMGATTAQQYSSFSSLISDSALSVLKNSADPTGAAAFTAISTYYAKLLQKAGTPELVESLFTSTKTPPSLSSSSSSSDAYLEAAYVNSIFMTLTTKTKFANIYGYNRNLTTLSIYLQDTPSMLESIQAVQKQILELLYSIPKNGHELTLVPAETNKWIWFTQLSMQYSPAEDHNDMGYLSNAVKWCCITSFWSVLLAALVGIYAAL